jgi:uncharacterized caspase-like protein
MRMRRALCVGIDKYKVAPLNGCVSDAERMKAVLQYQHDGTPNFECRTLIAPDPGALNIVTRSTLRKHLELLFKDPGHVVLFSFSGHGTINSLDGYLVTQDAKRYDEGVPMAEVLKMANDSKADEVVILLDCCHSGQLGNPPVIDNGKAYLREGISILTAGTADQPSVETGGGGLFTSLVVDALEGGAANILGAVSAPAIYAYVEAALGAWDQRPLFKAHVSNVVELRCCTPPIDRAILRRLPSLFPLPAEDRALDPSYERTSPSATPQNVATFRELQALHRVHLVLPVDALFMYDAAMNSKCCRLTPTGRYYWRLAKDARI